MFKIKNIFGKKKDQLPDQVPLARQRQEEASSRKVGAVDLEQGQNLYSDTKVYGGSGSETETDAFPSIPVDTLIAKARDIQRTASMSGTTKVSSQRSLSDDSNNRFIASESFAISSEQIERVPLSDDIDEDEDYEDSSVTNESQMEEEEIPETTFPEQKELKGYFLINKIGEGAFSAVFRGIPDKNSSQSFLAKSFQEVAVKVILKKEVMETKGAQKHGTKGATKEQVLKEVKIHRLVSSGEGSEKVVQFVDFQETEHYYYIIQEILSGGEIFGEIVKYTYFNEDLSRHVIKQLALAVRHLHSMGVVHRDIKPENLLFEPISFIPSKTNKLRKSDDPNTKVDEGEFKPAVGGGGIGVVKLADFGLSKQIYETNTKTPCGTVGYTAPEVVKDERYSMKVDMWGVGCVLYTLLCGFPPFYDEKIDILTEKIARGEYTFLRPWWDEISSGAKNCVRRLLEVDPHKRYSIDDLLNDEWLNSYDSIKINNDSKLHQKRKSRNHLYHKKKMALMQRDSSLLYSPAANAMRDAFDVSNAVQRIEGEKRENHTTNLSSLQEDEEDLLTSSNNNQKYNINLEENMFQLSLNSSTILKRRNENQTIGTNRIAIPTLIE